MTSVLLDDCCSGTARVTSPSDSVRRCSNPTVFLVMVGHCRSERLERRRGAGGSDFATEVDVLSEARVGVTELVGDGTGGEAGVAQHRRSRLAKDMAGDVAEAGVG